MSEKEILNTEELDQVSGGDGTIINGAIKVYCPQCGNEMYEKKRRNGKHGVIIRTYHCDACGHEIKKK